MKVLAVECEAWEQRAFAARLPEHETICAAGPLDALPQGAHADAQVLCPFVHSRLDAQALARFPALRLVATRSTGFDHIDLGACAARGILVCNVPDYGDRTVAEHTFALLLAVSRRLVEAVDATRRGEFSGERWRGFDLAGRTIGVIGAGRAAQSRLRLMGLAARSAERNCPLQAQAQADTMTATKTGRTACASVQARAPRRS